MSSPPPIEGRHVETGQPVRLTVVGAQIAAIESIKTAPDYWIAPGLIDLQVNGFRGYDVNAPNVTPDDISHLVRALWCQGVTTLCPTIITQSEARICHSLRAIAAARAADPLIAHAIPGIHIEGPAISREDGPRGAHPIGHVRPPCLAEYRRWQDAAAGHVKIITLAPEHPGAIEYIRAVAADGVIAAIGHTAATSGQIRAAVDAGARLSTHLGNGAHATLRRHPNYLWDQLADDRLMASLIADGHHLPPAVLTTFIRTKGLDRIILVSDAVAVAGLPPGVYDTEVGGRVELLPSGRLHLHGTPYLSGSVSPLPNGITNAIRHAGLDLAAAVRLATSNPARLLNLSTRGAIRPGATADLTLFRLNPSTHNLDILATIVTGHIVHHSPADYSPPPIREITVSSIHSAPKSRSPTVGDGAANAPAT